MTVVPITWESIASPLSSIVEMRDPFLEEGLRYKADYPNNGEPVWSIYLGSATETPRQIFASRRCVTNMVWEGTEIRARFATRQTAQVEGLGNVSFESTGFTVIAVESGQVESTLDALPFALADTSQPPLRSITIATSDGLDAMLLARRKVTGAWDRDAVMLIDAQGEAKELNGLPQGLAGMLVNWHWISDGTWLFGRSAMSYGLGVFIPKSGGHAIVVQGITYPLLTYEPSPAAPEQFVLLLGTEDPGVVEVALLDIESLAVNSVARVPFQPNRTLPSVTETGNLRMRQDNSVTEIDLATGVVEPQVPVPTSDPEDRVAHSRSPGDLYVLSFARPPESGPPRPSAECRGLPYKMSLTDLSSQASRVLLECEGGTSGSITWLSDARALVSIAGCWGCDGFPSRMLIIDARTGVIRDLAGTYEPGMLARPSSNGKLILLGGTNLRLIDDEGRLLQDYGTMPAGYSVQRIVWAMDSSQFAFLIGPTMWLQSGPAEWWTEP
jgi:hypothetical protein